MKHPTLNFDSLADLDSGTDEFGKAMMKIQLKFFVDCIVWGLEAHVQGQAAGKIPVTQGCIQKNLQLASFTILKQENQELCALLMEKDDDGKAIGDSVFGAALRHCLDKELITYNAEDGTVLPTWCDYKNPPSKEPKSDAELEERVVDGISYPLAASFSPTQVLFFAENKNAFDLMFPKGKHEVVQKSARHLREGLIYGTQHELAEGNSWLYTIKQEALPSLSS